MSGGVTGVRVATPEEAEKANAVVCLRVSELHEPYVDSEKDVCRNCGEEIWVSSSSPTAPIRVCLQCVHDGSLGEMLR